MIRIFWAVVLAAPPEADKGKRGVAEPHRHVSPWHDSNVYGKRTAAKYLEPDEHSQLQIAVISTGNGLDTRLSGL